MNGLGGHDASYLHLVWIVASLLGVGVLAVLTVAHRKARAQRDLDDAERTIAEAFPDDPV